MRLILPGQKQIDPYSPDKILNALHGSKSSSYVWWDPFPDLMKQMKPQMAVICFSSHTLDVKMRLMM